MNQLVAMKDPARSGRRPAGKAVSTASGEVPIAIEIRPLSACEAIRDEWTDLAGRALAPNLFFEPDFALAAAQHLVAFRQAVVLLAWQGSAGEPNRRLLGLIPCFPRNGLFVPDELIGFSNEHVLDGAPLLDARHAEAVVTAVLGLRQGWNLDGRGFVLRRLALDGPLVGPILRAAETRGLSVALRPAGPARAGRAPAAVLPLTAGLTIREATTRADIRDAVEILLALEASGPRGRAGTATLQDTREVGFLRAMTRGLARTRQCRLALLMLDGEPIAAALLLGRARRSFLYLTAESEAHAGLDPLNTLLALLRKGTPNRPILDWLASADQFGELRLVPQAALCPRDLAGRAREALRRGLRLGRAAYGG